MKKSHIFVLPSISEGFGMVILEAMAAGCPYVATDIPPIREITGGGMGGALCIPNDSKDLAEKIIYLLENKTNSDISRFMMRYDWPNISNSVERYYQQLI
jgi:Glycosyltransferase